MGKIQKLKNVFAIVIFIHVYFAEKHIGHGQSLLFRFISNKALNVPCTLQIPRGTSVRAINQLVLRWCCRTRSRRSSIRNGLAM